MKGDGREMGVLAGFHHGSSNHPTRAGSRGRGSDTFDDEKRGTIIGRAIERSWMNRPLFDPALFRIFNHRFDSRRI